LKHWELDWRLLLGVAAVLGLAATVSLRHLLRKPDDPEGEERRRRARLNQVGRIVEGYIIDIVESLTSSPSPSGTGLFSRSRPLASRPAEIGPRRLVRYSYSISGVTYETAQDVTGLEERLCLERLAAGQSASVKYDPSNPGDSILVADDWSGVH
jgi:Protein of unknown function (DUF3592)